jgi:xylulokinase
MSYILAFDVGTSTLKAALVGHEGKIKARAKASYPTDIPAEGFAEQNPQHWWNAVVKTTHEVVLKAAIEPDDVDGIVFATQAIGIVPISKEDGKPLCPAIIWIDSRGDAEATEIMDAVGGKEAFEQLAGVPLNGKDVIPKVLWLSKNRPELMAKMDCFLDVNGYLRYRCTGDKAYDYSSASAVCLDSASGTMIEPLLAATGMDPASFPKLIRSEACVGPLTKEAARELGLSPSTKVYGGTNDMQAATLGSGMNSNGEGHFSLGTSGWCVGFADEMALLSNGGASIQSAEYGKFIRFYQPEAACTAFNWFCENFYACEMKEKGDGFYKFVQEEVSKIPAGSDALIFNPWMAGERSPVTDLFLRGGFLNLGFSHTRAHMLRAVMEGIAYNLRWSYEGFEKDYGHGLATIRVLGGGSNDPVWMQIFADIFNKRVEVLYDSQAAGTIGAAFLAALGQGLFKDFQDVKKWARVEHSYFPNKENAGIYENIYQNFKFSYEGVKDLYHKLNKDRIKE